MGTENIDSNQLALLAIILGTIIAVTIVILITVISKKRKTSEKIYNDIEHEKRLEYIRSLQSEPLKVEEQEIINSENRFLYQLPTIYQKKRLLTNAEIAFYNKLLKITEDYNVIVYPQVNLAAVINKTIKAKYRNELFRNIDFGIFDKEYNVIALIELNDTTHLQANRRKRDNTVKNICNIAKVPLITFWTNYENETSYIENKIIDYIEHKKKAA